MHLVKNVEDLHLPNQVQREGRQEEGREQEYGCVHTHACLHLARKAVPILNAYALETRGLWQCLLQLGCLVLDIKSKEGIVVPRTKGSQGLTAAVLPTSALFHALDAESFRKIDTALLRMLSASTQKAVWTPHMVSAEGLCTVQLVEL